MRRFKNLLTVLISTILSLLIFEGGLRLIYPDKMPQKKTRDHSDSLLPKMAKGIFTSSTFGTSATFDNQGFRESKNNCQTEGTKKILIVGDSNIAALFLNDGEDLASQLSNILNEKECYSVKPFGVPGYGPDQSYFAMEHFTRLDNYRYVIFHIFADNDAGDLIRNNYTISQDGRLLNSGYCYKKKHWIDHIFTARVFRRAIYSASGYYIDWNPTRNSLDKDNLCTTVPTHSDSNIGRRLFKRAALDKAIFRENKSQIYMGDRFDIEFACKTDQELINTVEKKLQAIAKNINNIAQERNFEPIVLIQPSEFDVTDNHLDISTFMQRNCENYDRKNLTNLFSQTFEGKMKVINLFDKFDGCKDCYFSNEEAPGDSHWNAVGVKLAAEELSQVILEK